MVSTNWIRGSVVALASLLLVPATTLAQAGIAGGVTDTTGAILPGVTVEASSPALIEKVRAVVTDGQGQYKIIDLRPGVYTVTFTLPGFSTVRREGIELSGSFTATVNAEMRVGAVEETVTVSGQSPVVDVQNVAQNRVITTEVINALPTSRTFHSIAAVIPALRTATVSGPTTQDVGGSAGDRTQTLVVHGSRSGDMQNMVEGILNNNANGLQSTGMFFDTGSIQEFSYQLGAISAETTTGGVHVNMIPKDGGNRFTGSFFTAFTNHSLQWDNITDDLRARGLPEVNHQDKIWDLNPSIGGPIKRDKLWFYLSGRYWGVNDRVAGMWYDTDPTDFMYTPDFSRRAIDDTWLSSGSLRPTWQITQKNKLVGYLLVQGRCLCHAGTNTITPPEVSILTPSPIDQWESALWTSTITNRLLLEVGASHHLFTQLHLSQPNVTPDILAVKELSTGFNLRAPAIMDRTEHGPTVNYKAALSYVTGSHAFKGGFNLQQNQRHRYDWTNGSMVLQLLNGVPRSVVVNTTPYDRKEKLNAALGIYGQDQWTLKRLTLNLGVRFDYHNASVPEQHVAAAPFVPARDFAAIPDVPNWTDLAPRLGASYDLFGTGKTALKVTLSRYLAGELFAGITSGVNPVNTTVNSATRTWTDRNGDFIPQDNELGPLSNASFGKLDIRTRYDDAIRSGFGSRGFNWETSAAIQHELLPNVSVNASYARRWYGNFTITDNLLVAPADFDPYCVTAPVDARLPGGGGQQVCGLYDITSAKFGQSNSLVTFAERFGTQTDVYDGFDFTMNARLSRGAFLAGGLNLGRSATDRCFVVDSPEELRFCKVGPPFQPQVKFFGSYPLPWGLQTSATFQSLSGAPITATWVVPNEQIRGSLGRNLAAGANATKTVELITPGTLYSERINEVDFRISKIVRVGRLRVQGNMDLYNLLNVSTVIVQNATYGPQWQQPQYVLPGRLFKFGAQVDF